MIAPLNHPEFHPAFFGDHVLVPRRIPDEFDLGVIDEDTVLGSPFVDNIVMPIFFGNAAGTTSVILYQYGAPDNAANDYLIANMEAVGGVVPDDCTPFDVVSFPYGEAGPVVSGVLWRLVLRAEAGEAAEIGEKLAVARHRKQGLLINPHMESWFAVTR